MGAMRSFFVGCGHGLLPISFLEEHHVEKHQISDPCRRHCGAVRRADPYAESSASRFRHVGDEGITYPRARLILDGNEYTPIPGARVEAGEGTAVDVYAGMRVPADEELKTQGDCVRF